MTTTIISIDTEIKIDEVDLINTIEKDKLTYFKKNIKILNDSLHINHDIVKQYLNIYFLETLFEEESVIYTEFYNMIYNDYSIYTSDNDINVLDLYKFITKDNMNIFIKKFITNLTQNKFHNYKLNRIYNIIINNKIIELISDTEFINYDIDNTDFIGNYITNYYDMLLLEGILVVKSEKDYIEFNQDFYNLMFCLIKNKTIRPNILKWYCDYYNNNKNTTGELLEKYKFKENYIALVISNSLLKIWDNGVTFDKIEKIDLNYVYSDKCELNYVDNNNNNNNNHQFNFITSGMFIINKLLEKSLLEIFDKKKYLSEQISYLTNEIKKYNIQSLEYLDFTLAINILKMNLSDVNKLLDLNKSNNNCYYIFYQNMCYYLVKNKDLFNENTNIISDNLLENYKIFLENYDKKDIDYDSIFQELFIEVFNGKFTNNNDLKADLLALIEYGIGNKNIELDIFFTNKNYELLKILFNSYNNFENCFEDTIDKINSQSIIHNILSKKIIYTYDSNTDYNISFIASNDKLIINKFVNNLLGNIYNLTDNLIECVKTDKSYNFYFNEIVISLYVLEKLTKIIPKNFLVIGIKTKFAELLNFITFILNKYYDKIEESNKTNNINIDIIVIYKIVNSIILSYIEIDNIKTKLIELLVENNQYFNIEYYRKIAVYLKKKIVNLTDIEVSNMNSFINALDDYNIKFKERETEEADNDYEIPDEFLDPIMQTLITHPVMLPNSDIIMDKGVIVRHLLSNEYNPFSRAKLTLKMLDDYNNESNIKSKLDEFKLKLNNQLKLNKIK